MNDHLLHPAYAASLLASGNTPPSHVWPWLDVKSCQLRPTVDAQGEPPCVVTGHIGFGDPVSGIFTLDPETIQKIQQRDERVICGVNGRGKDIFNVVSLKPEGMVCLFSQNDKALINSHFIGEAAHHGTALIDNPADPRISWDKKHPYVAFQNRALLYEGEKITIDPSTGSIWRGIKPIQSTPKYIETLISQLQTDFTAVAGHLLRPEDFSYLYRAFQEPFPIGLWTTERDFFNHAKISRSSIWNEVLRSNVPRALMYWERENLCCAFPQNYRLVDFHGIVELLPKRVQKEIKMGLDHQVETQTFELRKQLYRLQLKNAFCDYSDRDFYKKYPKTVILPHTANAREVGCLLSVVREETSRLGISDLIGVGSMIETEKALNNAEEIVKLCSSLCIGLGDLTASVTGENRSDLSLECWHKLDLRVKEKLGLAIRKSRQVRPDIFINVAGNQLNDPESLESILKMGIDQVSLFPVKENVDRARLTIRRHVARQSLKHPSEQLSRRTAFPASSLTI